MISAARGERLFARGVLRFQRAHDFLCDRVEFGHEETTGRKRLVTDVRHDVMRIA